MATASLEKIVKAAVERGASDLHIKAGDVFRARVDGKLVPLTKERLTPAQTRTIAGRLVGGPEGQARLDALRDHACSWELPGVGRFRINILRQRSSLMVVMRVIPFTVPSIESLQLPDAVRSMADADRGLVLVAGTSGSGKSSTVAAILHHINQHHPRHIVTIEDPIEFVHRDLVASVTQREVGVDTESAEAGLRAALRQDPDVIVLGEVRDAGAATLAIEAAETGRLVVAMMPAPTAVAAVGRVLAMLPNEERALGRIRVADALCGVVAQQLVPQAGGQGRIPVVEMLSATPAVRRLLRQPDHADELEGRLKEGGPGMTSFAAHAAQLLARDLIVDAVAQRFLLPEAEVDEAAPGRWAGDL